MKRMRALIAAIVLIFLLSAGVSYAVSPKEQTTICAEDHLDKVLQLARDFPEELNFTDETEVGEAVLGPALNNFSIPIGEFDPESSIRGQEVPIAFYDFPVMVGNQIRTDATFVLEDGKWQWVDIGGGLCEHVYKMALENGLSPEDVDILRFAGGTFLVAEKGGKEIAYSP